MEHLGNIFRYIRQSKSISLAKLADNKVSVSQLSKFERGLSELSVDKFFYLLEKLDVSLEELALLNNFKQRDKTILFEINELYNKKDSFLLDKKGLIYKKYYHSTQQIKYLHFHYLCQVLVHNLNHQPIPIKIETTIWQHLMSVETWSYYELVLFNNFIFIFSEEKVTLLSKTILKRADFYKKIPSSRHEYPLIVLNLISFYLERKNLRQAELYIQHLDTYLNHPDFIYEKNKLNFLKGILLIHKNQLSEGIAQAKQAITIFSMFDLSDIADTHQRYLDELLNTQKQS